MNKRVTNKSLTKIKVNKFKDGKYIDKFETNWTGDNLPNNAISSGIGALGLVTDAINLSKTGPNKGIDIINDQQESIDAIASQRITANDRTALNEQISNLNYGNLGDFDETLSLTDAGGTSGADWTSGLIGGAIKGASIVPGDPISMAIGAAVGTAANAIGLGFRNKNAKQNIDIFNKQQEANKAKLEQANIDLKNNIMNMNDQIAKRELNNFKLNNIDAYGGPLFNHTGDWSNKNYIENEEYDLNEEEIKKLLDLGYEIEYV